MILLTRVVARDFLALFSRCVSGRPRGPAPPVLIRIQGGVRTVTATTPEGVVLTQTSPAPEERDDCVLLPATVLAEVEGGTDEKVTLERQSKLRAVVRWHGGSKPRTLAVELILPGKQHEVPAPPELSAVSHQILAALHESGRSAARESGRYALAKVQLQGRAGRVVGTDGKSALLWTGFAFPFTDDILVHALPVFGSKPLTRIADVRIGRTATHLMIAAGPWAVSLPVETKARYPDVASVIPSYPPTVVGVDGRDAAEFLKLLPGLPGGDEENRAVTLDADGVLTVRARDPVTGDVKEVPLRRSPVSGPALQVTLDRRLLARAFSLGCHTLRLTPDKPVVAEGDSFTFVVAPLDNAQIVSAATSTQPTAAVDVSITPTETTSQRSKAMPQPETNAHTSPRGDPADPLVAAEELRDALADAATKAARLVVALKAALKEKKVLAGVYAGLKQLNLDVPNGQI